MTAILDQFGQPFNYSTSIENPALSLDDPSTWDGLFGKSTEAGVEMTPRRALGHAPVWRGINLISNSVAKLPLVVYKQTSENARSRDKTHPAYRLLKRRPNRFVDAFQFRRTLTYHACFYGNGYASIFRDRHDKPEDLVILPPTQTYPIQYDGELWYIACINGENRRIPARDVLHIRGLSFDGLCGYSVYDLMAEALGVGLAARSFSARFFGDGANASGILMVPQAWDEKKMKALLAAFNQMATGLTKAHKVALLQEGAKFVPTTVDPEKSQLHETHDQEIRTAANILGLPPHKLGDNSKSSYNSLESENRAYLQDSLDPWLVAWESECNHKLLSEEEQTAETHYCEHIRDALERTDTKSEIESLGAQVEKGLMNQDEARAIRNLPPLPDGLGKKFYRSANIVEVGAPAAVEAFDAMARDRIDRLIGIETEKTRQQAAGLTPEDAPKFCAWVDRFYGSHRKKFTTGLSSLVRMACALFGQPNPEALTAQIVDDHIAHSIEQLKTATTFDEVSARLESWPTRTDTILASMKGPPHATAA